LKNRGIMDKGGPITKINNPNPRRAAMDRPVNQGFLPLHFKLIAIVFSLLLTGGCVSFHKRMSPDLFPKLQPGVTAAVSYIPERETGDVTALGNLWRDRIEKILAQRGVVVKARRDITALIEDMETFGAGKEEQDVWEAAGADVLVCGNYTLFKAENGKGPGNIRVVAKAYRGSVLVDAEEFMEPLDPSWTGLAAKIFGNVHQEKFEVVSSGTTSEPVLELDVTLNRKNNCFAPGEKAKLHVRTRPGTHLYIFNLTADGNVTLIYPNKWMVDRPLAFGDFVFPPPGQARYGAAPLSPGRGKNLQGNL